MIEVGDSPVGVSTGGRPLATDQPLLVFVHGAGLDRTIWQLQTRYFAAHGFSVFAVDLPGHGRTPGPAPASIAAGAAWLVEVVAAAGFDTAHVVGHSMGGLMALELAATHPTRVASLTLLGVAERIPVHPDLLAAAETDDHLAVELVSSWSLGRPAHRGGHPTPGLWMMGSAVRLLERAAPGTLHAGLAACDAYQGAADAAAAVQCATLLLLGELDLMTKPRAAEPLAATLADATVVVVPGAGHLLMVENPDVVIDTLAQFLVPVA